MVEECHAVQQYQMGDFYPLTPYSLEPNVWVAWQWHRPGDGSGVVQAFRRGECNADSIRLKLRGLEAGARYAVRDADEGKPVEMTGEELMDTGLPVVGAQRPAALVVWYAKAK